MLCPLCKKGVIGNLHYISGYQPRDGAKKFFCCDKRVHFFSVPAEADITNPWALLELLEIDPQTKVFERQHGKLPPIELVEMHRQWASRWPTIPQFAQSA